MRETLEPIRLDSGKTVKVIRCNCGCTVELWSGWSNGCDKCNECYNGFGQRLVPASQWEEDLDYC